MEMIRGFTVKRLRGNGYIFIWKIQKYVVIVLSRVKRLGVIKCKCSNMTMGSKQTKLLIFRPLTLIYDKNEFE